MEELVEDVLDIESELVSFYRTCKSPAVRLDALLALQKLRAEKAYVLGPVPAGLIDNPAGLSSGVLVPVPAGLSVPVQSRPGYRVSKSDKCYGTACGVSFENRAEFYAIPVIAAVEADFLFIDNWTLYSSSRGQVTEVCGVDTNSYLPNDVLIKEG